MSDDKKYTNILTKGYQSSLNELSVDDGKLRFTKDTGRLYLDIVEGGNSKRIRISDIEDTMTEEQIFNILVPLPKVYLSSDTHRAYVCAAGQWFDLGELNLKVSSGEDKDIPIIFSSTDDNEPMYDTNLSYNPSTRTLKAESLQVNSLKITDTVGVDGFHTVEFNFV